MFTGNVSVTSEIIAGKYILDFTKSPLVQGFSDRSSLFFNTTLATEQN